MLCSKESKAFLIPKKIPITFLLLSRLVCTKLENLIKASVVDFPLEKPNRLFEKKFNLLRKSHNFYIKKLLKYFGD